MDLLKVSPSASLHSTIIVSPKAPGKGILAYRLSSIRSMPAAWYITDSPVDTTTLAIGRSPVLPTATLVSPDEAQAPEKKAAAPSIAPSRAHGRERSTAASIPLILPAIGVPLAIRILRC